MVRYNLLSDRELNYVIWNERFAKTTKRQKRASTSVQVQRQEQNYGDRAGTGVSRQKGIGK